MQHRTNFQLAMADIVEGISSVHIWSALGWQEVMQRYRRSVLGPFWLTISTALMVGIMGPLYGKLFSQDVGTYFAHLAVSLVLWQTISQIMLDSSIAFIVSDIYIKQVRLPLSIHILRTLWKNLVILFHNFAVVVIVIIFFRAPARRGLAAFSAGPRNFRSQCAMGGILLGMVCARFRDIPLVVTNVMQVAFFLTPDPVEAGNARPSCVVGEFQSFLSFPRNHARSPAGNADECAFMGRRGRHHIRRLWIDDRFLQPLSGADRLLDLIP